MPFFIFLIYVALIYVYPAEIFPALAPYRITLGVGIAALGVSALWIAFKRSAVLSTVQFWFLLALMCSLVLSRILGERWLGAVVPAVTQFAPSAAMFLLAICAVDSVRKIRIAAAFIGLMSLVLVVQGVAAYHFGYNTRMFLFDPVTRAEYVATVDPSETAQSDEPADADESEFDSDIDPGSTLVRIRGLGLLHDPNDLALGLVMALPLLGIAWRKREHSRNFFLVLLPCVALIYGLFLTRSRGGVLAVAVTLCVVASRRVGRAAAVVLLALMFAGGLAADFASGRQLSLADDSATGRVEAWSEGLQMLKSEPLLGVGYGQFLDHHTLTAHNSFVLCFAEAGLIGYFFWLGIIVVTVIQLQGLKHLGGDDPPKRELQQLARAFQLALIAFMTAAFFLSRSFIPMLYLLTGLCVALVLIARDAKQPVWSPSIPQIGTVILTCEVVSILFMYALLKVYRA